MYDVIISNLYFRVDTVFLRMCFFRVFEVAVPAVDPRPVGGTKKYQNGPKNNDMGQEITEEEQEIPNRTEMDGPKKYRTGPKNSETDLRNTET